jgi:hypothetical protein
VCTKRNIPPAFRTTLLDALQDCWLQGLPPLELRSNSPAVNRLIHSQRKIGCPRFFRGFLSKRWLRYLEYEHHRTPKPPTHFDYDDFFRVIIKTLWHHQSTFWKEYQQSLHQTSTNEPSMTRTNLIQEIRHLFSFRNAVAPAHKDEYFPANLKRFLHTSSTTHLQNYVLNYKQPIHRSALAEKRKPDRTRKIWSFCGFTRRRVSVSWDWGVLVIRGKGKGKKEKEPPW